MLIAALVIGANAQAQGLSYRIDLERPGQHSFMSVTTMLVGQKGMVSQQDADGNFVFVVEPKEVQADGTVNATATFDSTKDGRPVKDTVSLNLKRGESRQLFQTASLKATVTLQK